MVYRVAKLKDLTDVWSKGQKATRSSIHQARHQLPDIQAEIALGKRDPADLSRQELEQTSIKEASGSGADLSRADADMIRIKPIDSMLADMVVSLVDEKLKASPPWPGDLSKLKKSKNRIESEDASVVQSGRREKDKKETQKALKKTEEPVVNHGSKKKAEKAEPMIEEDVSSREKLTRRENPFKIKNFNNDDIYYPEDFLVKGLFPSTSKASTKRYIDLRMELAFPLSQNIILRNENVVSITQLEGRLYKYLDENNIVKTLQFLGSVGEELIFVDLQNNRRMASPRGNCR
jgi:hypothetical protein